jgi:hypothetical protein
VKYSITRAVLGILIILFASYIVWWMMSGVNTLLADMVLNENGELVNNVTPKNEILFNIARYSSISLPALGLFICAGSIWMKKDYKKAALMHIISGGLVLTVSIFILIWGYAFDFIHLILGGPVIDMGQARVLTALTAFIGLVVSGLSIVQLVKANNSREGSALEKNKNNIESFACCIPHLSFWA